MQERSRTLAVLVTVSVFALFAVAEASAHGAEPGAPMAARAFSPKERQKLTAIVEQAMIKKRIPGLNVGIRIPGLGTWVRSFGTANLTTGSPMRAADHFRIASITKTFTATAIVQLVDQGRVGLDDKLCLGAER